MQTCLIRFLNSLRQGVQLPLLGSSVTFQHHKLSLELSFKVGNSSCESALSDPFIIFVGTLLSFSGLLKPLLVP